MKRLFLSLCGFLLLLALSNFASASGYSSLTPEEQIVDVDESAIVSVSLFDTSGLPVRGHELKLVASSDDVVISDYSGKYTDDDGFVSFLVDSRSEGIVSLNALDLTSNTILPGSAKVAFYDYDGSYVESTQFPDDFSYAAARDESAAADYLKFENGPNYPDPNTALSFDIAVYDILDQVVPEYEGTIAFEVVDGNPIYVDLPNEYDFTTDDLGTHTFSLAINFLEDGRYTIRAYDVENEAIFGEYLFLVGDPEDVSGSGIIITNPVDGTYSNSVQQISGTAPSSINLTIFDNEVPLVTLWVGNSGEFDFTTDPLSDGLHRIYAAEVNEIGTIVQASETVELNIDTVASAISSVVLEPGSTVGSGDAVTAKVYVDGELSSGQLFMNQNIYDLVDSGAGYYMVEMTAPLNDGQYPIDVTIYDDLENETTASGIVTLTVMGQEPVDVGLSDVSGLRARGEDQRVILAWSPVVGANEISNYRVYYGLGPNELYDAVDTYTNGTDWYIPNLMNGVEYYFAVIAVDVYGNTSEHFSNIVSTIPMAPAPVVVESEPVDVVNGLGGGDNFEDMEADVSDSGPGLNLLIAIGFFGGLYYSSVRKKRESLV
ncbi:fibronectin type III domain-containing protein [Patescibacteria group bacterium]|nr:fibronectin type III domain-containing protein [Patescibacteria group bacterium]